jgi:hypothetical protein
LDDASLDVYMIRLSDDARRGWAAAFLLSLVASTRDCPTKAASIDRNRQRDVKSAISILASFVSEAPSAGAE